MKTEEKALAAALAKSQEAAVLELAAATNRARSATGSPPAAVQEMAADRLRWAQANAEVLGILPPNKEIFEIRSGGAHLNLLRAQKFVARAADAPPDVRAAAKAQFLDAVAVAKEWGVIA
jgi:hypothetical protein